MTDNDKVDEFYALLSKSVRATRDWACFEEDHPDAMEAARRTMTAGELKCLRDGIALAKKHLEDMAQLGLCCRKGSETCYCKVGWPYEKQCPDCRDTWKKGQFRDSRCICPGKGPVLEPSETQKLWAKLESGDTNGVIMGREVARGNTIRYGPMDNLEAQIARRELKVLEVIRGTAQEGYVRGRSAEGPQGDAGVQEPHPEVVERPEGDQQEAGHSHRAERGISAGEGDEEAIPVTVDPPCSKCGINIFWMKSYASSTPVPEGFSPLIDRLLTCMACGHEILYKDTYMTKA